MIYFFLLKVNTVSGFHPLALHLLPHVNVHLDQGQLTLCKELVKVTTCYQLFSTFKNKDDLKNEDDIKNVFCQAQFQLASSS